MPPARRPRTSALDALECLYLECMRMFVRRGNLKCDLRIRYQGQLPPPASHRHSHPPLRRLYSPHRQSPTESPEPDGSIPAPALYEIPEDTDSEDHSLHRRVAQPHSPAQASDTEEANPGETPMDKEIPEIEVHPTAGRTFGDDPDYNEFQDLIDNPWQPFYCAEDFKQAIRFVEAHYPKLQIDCHFNEGGCKIPEHFSYTSGWTMYNQIYRMDNQLPKWRETSISTPNGRRFIYFRDPVECARHLLRQRPYKYHMVYGPTRVVDVEGDRVYSEMNSADWWWETQDRLPPGATIVPLICGSDETQLMDFSGDKKAWPIYLTIGNIHSSIRNKYSYLAHIVLAFLPVPPKFQRNSASDDRAQRDIGQQVLCDIAKIVLEPVTRFPKGVYINSGSLWPCSTGKMRRNWPILASWLADHMEHANLMGIKYNACPKCQTPKDKLGSHILPPDLESYRRKSAVFQEKFREYQNAKTATDRQAIKITEDWFEFISARPVLCIFWDLLHVEAYDLHRPDILHNIYIGMFDHLMTWIEGFLQRHGKAAVSDEIWAGIPPYPNIYHCGKAYRQISQWSRKEMRNFGRIIYPALAAALHDPLPRHRAVFRRALTCVRSLVYWSPVVQYQTHTTETLNYLADYLE